MINLKRYPPDWKILKLGQIGSFSKGRGIAKADLQDTGIPCIRYGEIYTSHHHTVKNFHSFISRETANCSRKLGFNDLLFAGSGETPEDIGKAVAYRLPDEAYVGGDVVILSVPEKYRSDYIAYFLNSVGRYQLNKLGSGYSVVHIYSRDLEKVKIPLPKKYIQDRVVEILQTWDTAIEKTEKLIAEKEKQFGWLVDMLIDNPSNALEWNKVSLGDAGYFYTGLSQKSKNDFGHGKPYLPYLNIFSNSQIDPRHLDYVDINKGEKQNAVKKGDIFFTISSETSDEVGMSSVLLDDIPDCYLNSFCFGWRCTVTNIASSFLQYYFRSSGFRRQVVKLAQGVTRFNLSKKQLVKTYIYYPNIKQQKDIFLYS